MKIDAVVYTSNTGFTERYAKLFGERTGLSVYSSDEAKAELKKGSNIIYFGWLMAGSVVGYAKAAKNYRIAAVCGVSLAPTGTMTENVRKSCKLSDTVPAFSVQGGMDHKKLKGVYGSMIKVLIKFMSKKKKHTPEDDAMLELLIKGGDYVSEENLFGILDWYKSI